MSTIYDLGPLTGGKINQYSTASGQVYYYDTVSLETSYSVPQEFEDNSDDEWTLDSTKNWPQWNNKRTGRAALSDPKPPPPQTYLDLPAIMCSLKRIITNASSSEGMRRGATENILRFIFPERETYYVGRGYATEIGRPHVYVSIWFQAPGGPRRQYDVLHAHCEKDGTPWFVAEDRLLEILAQNTNESKSCYGMVQVGPKAQFYKYGNRQLGKVGVRMHLVDDASDVVSCGTHVKTHPLPVV